MSHNFLIISTILIFTTHKNKSPFFINLGIILIILTSARWTLWVNNKWIFRVIVIFYLGGMIVLFAYIISLTKSKHIFFNFPLIRWLIIPILITGFYRFTETTNQFYFTTFLHSSFQFIIVLAIVLLILLIVVNKICISYQGPLTFKNHDD